MTTAINTGDSLEIKLEELKHKGDVLDKIAAIPATIVIVGVESVKAFIGLGIAAFGVAIAGDIISNTISPTVGTAISEGVSHAMNVAVNSGVAPWAVMGAAIASVACIIPALGVMVAKEHNDDKIEALQEQIKHQSPINNIKNMRDKFLDTEPKNTQSIKI